jgi:nucleoside-diphosphate-sugar epimerase
LGLKSSVLCSGSTGFIGRYFVNALSSKRTVVGIGRNAESDIQWCMGNESCPELLEFNHVVHAAGLAHTLPKNAHEAAAFNCVNVEGTRQLLQAIEKNPPKSFVFLSTVAVYGMEMSEGISESHPLHGSSPYAQSKIRAEGLVREFCKHNAIDCLILRLPLVAGVQPPGNLGSMSKAIRTGRYLRIGKAQARKSMVLAEDIAALVLNWIGNPEMQPTTRPSGTYNLTDGHHPSLHQLEDYLCRKWGRRGIPAITAPMAGLIGKAGDIIPGLPFNSQTYTKLCSTLTFSDAKARAELGWNPRSVLDGEWG